MLLEDRGITQNGAVGKELLEVSALWVTMKLYQNFLRWRQDGERLVGCTHPLGHNSKDTSTQDQMGKSEMRLGAGGRLEIIKEAFCTGKLSCYRSALTSDLFQ